VTYDGNPHTATVTSITGVDGETGAAVGTVALNSTHTDAGTYNGDAWRFIGAANYNDIASTPLASPDIIQKATATVVVTPYTVTYDGNPHTATVTSITGVNGDTGATVGAVDVSNTTHTNAGIYSSDSWSFTGTNYNNIASTTITDTINAAPLTVNPASPTPTTPPILLEVMDSRLWVVSTQTGQVLLSVPLSFGAWRVVQWEIVPGTDGLPNVIFTLQNKHHHKQMRMAQADGSVLLRLVQQLAGLPSSVVVAELGGDGFVHFIVGTDRGGKLRPQFVV
jgi:hypothetical protein